MYYKFYFDFLITMKKKIDLFFLSEIIILSIFNFLNSFNKINLFLIPSEYKKTLSTKFVFL